MKTLDLREIASEYDLEFVETTDQMNGYPSNIKGAIIGFDNFELAEELANKYSLDIEVLTRHDGQQLWHRTGNWANGPLEITENDFGDDFSFLSDDENFYDNEVKPFLDDFDNLDDLMAFVKGKAKIAEELATVGDDYVVVTCQGKYYDTINTRPMMFENDGKYWTIALIDRNA